MEVLAKTGKEDLAQVYIARTSSGKLIEFAESLQPPLTRDEKWVMIISTLYGCPVGCRFCEAGGDYHGKLSSQEIMDQIDYLSRSRFPDRIINSKKFKIQFARMGEPSFNENVLEVLDSLPDRYQTPGLMVSLSTVAPESHTKFFEKLLEIKNEKYRGKFQFQFSIHTTDEKIRRWLIPIKTWSFRKMADYGSGFYQPGDRKITLNFALAAGMPLHPAILSKNFDPEKFLIKITPVNPTAAALRNKISTSFSFEDNHEVIESLRDEGYEVILSIGELEENQIGSNCGQYITNYRKNNDIKIDGYTYKLQSV